MNNFKRAWRAACPDFPESKKLSHGRHLSTSRPMWHLKLGRAGPNWPEIFLTCPFTGRRESLRYPATYKEQAIDTLEQARLAFEACIDKKGQDIRLLGVGDLTIVAEYFVICTALSPQQASGIAEAIRHSLKEKCSRLPLAIEGGDSGWWVLVDYGDFICHIFLEEARQYYAIEQTWADAKELAKFDGRLLRKAE